MKLSKLHVLCFLAFVLVLSSCKRSEPTTWDSDVKGPIAYGALSLQNIVADSLLQADDQGLWHLMLEENLTDFDLDSIVEIPDTTIVKEYQLFVVGSFPPGFTLPIAPTQQITINHPSVQLKHVRMRSGKLSYRLQSPVEGYLNCTFNLPGLTLNGVPQSIQILTQPPSDGLNYVAEGFIDLANMELDLTGESGSSFNRIEATFSVVVDPNSTESANISVGDAIELELEFVEPKVNYARGYFGSHNYALNEQVDFSAFASMPDGVVNLDGASMQFLIRNAVGVDAQIDFNSISNWNQNQQSEVFLEQPELFSPINITRAQDAGGNVNAYEYAFDVNAANSNLDAFLENLPSQIRLQGDVRINPLGNVSDGNDFIYTADALQAKLSLDVPLRLGLQNMHIADTLYLTNSAEDIPLDGKLALWLRNGFPLNARVSLFVLENGQRVALAENMEVLSATPTSVPSAPVPAETWIDIPVTEELLAKINESNPVLIEAWLQTPGAPSPVGLYAHQQIEFKLIVDGTYMIQYGE
jgi:hypothetical protein